MNLDRGSMNFDLLYHCQQDQLYSEDEEDIYESGDFIWGDFGSSSNYKPSTSSSHRTNVKNIRQDSTRNGQSTVIPLPWKPSIVEGLRDQVVAEGEELVFQVKVQGEIKEVKWRKDGQPAEKNSRAVIEKIDNETYRLTITKAEFSDAGEFEIQLINDVGKAVSSAHAEIGQIPKIVKGLVPTEIDEDDDIVFSVEVSDPVSEVKWYKNGQEIKPSSHFKIQCCRNLKDLEPKKYKLGINKVEMDDGGIYKVILSNKFGSRESEAALIVNKTSIVKITKSLRDIAGTTDQNHNFPTILASESNSSFNDALILDSSQMQSVEMSNSESGKHLLLIPDSTPSDNSLYGVDFQNDEGADVANEAVAHVRANIVQPNVTTVNFLPPLENTTVDEEVLFQVSSHNSGGKLIQEKQRKRTIAMNDRNSPVEASSKRSSDSTKYTIQIPKRTQYDMNLDRGSMNFDLLYHCQQDQLYSEDEEDIYESGDFIWGDFGSSSNYKPSTSSSHRTNVKNIRQDSTRNGQSTVIPLPWKPSIVEGLRDQVVAEGEELVFQVKVQGEIKEVKWRKDGQPAEKNSRAVIEKIDNETYRLTITKAEFSDAGEFEIQLINDVGKAVSSAHAEIGQIPKIVKGLVPTEIDEDDDIVFSVEVSDPVSEVKWYKNGQEIKPSSHFKIQCCRNLKDLEPKKYKLGINKVEMDDGGIYKVILSNKFGSRDSEAALIVNKTSIVKITKSLRDIAGTTDQNHNFPTILASESNSSFNDALILDSSQMQSVEMSNSESGKHLLLIPDSTPSDNSLYGVDFQNDEGADVANEAVAHVRANIVQPNVTTVNFLPPLENTTVDEEVLFQVSSHNSGGKLIQEKQRKRTIAMNDRNSPVEASSKRSNGKPKKTNSSEKPYKCDRCSFASVKKNLLVIHTRTHTGEKPYKCEQCSYASAQKGTLDNHVRTHTGEKPFKCNECSHAFAESGNLKIHMRTHTGEKPFKCNECSYASAERGSLKTHLRTHTGEKPFKCNKCSYACTTGSSLTIHMRKHSGEKPYKCNQCSFACITSGHLSIHMRKHSGEKPYKCSECPFAGISSSSLHQHIRNHHSKEME